MEHDQFIKNIDQLVIMYSNYCDNLDRSNSIDELIEHLDNLNQIIGESLKLSQGQMSNMIYNDINQLLGSTTNYQKDNLKNILVTVHLGMIPIIILKAVALKHKEIYRLFKNNQRSNRFYETYHKMTSLSHYQQFMEIYCQITRTE